MSEIAAGDSRSVSLTMCRDSSLPPSLFALAKSDIDEYECAELLILAWSFCCFHLQPRGTLNVESFGTVSNDKKLQSHPFPIFFGYQCDVKLLLIV